MPRETRPPIDPNRTGPSRPQDVPEHIRQALSRGEIPSVNLAEGLAIDDATLLFHAAPDIGEPAVERMRRAHHEGVTKRNRLAAELLLDRFGPGRINQLAASPSDTVRGWACQMIGLVEGWDLARRLDEIKPFADDAHFGVREWAWMALRRPIIDELDRAIELLTPWVTSHRPWIRRFAVEATRPRGVWCPHIAPLKQDPEPGRPLLDPLRDDPAPYVQNAVANWLNDAGKSRPDWVLALTDRWLAESEAPQTARIVKRARRNL
ncbi:MAG: HEAT repeat domain-containing protein [Phycisphaerales bacterium]